MTTTSRHAAGDGRPAIRLFQAAPQGRRAQRTASLLRYLVTSISAAVLVLVLAVAVAVIGLPTAVGGSAMTVLTQSMEPGLPPGTLVVIKPKPADEIRVGEVITYQIRSGDPAVVSHRVIGKTYANGELTFTTQGDNNGAPDAEPVQPLQIRGVLWYSLPLLGWVNTIINGPARAYLVPAAAGALFVYAAGMVVAALRDRRRTRRAAAATTESADLAEPMEPAEAAEQADPSVESDRELTTRAIR